MVLAGMGHRYSLLRIHMRVNQPAMGGRQAEQRRWTNTAAVKRKPAIKTATGRAYPAAGRAAR